MPQHQEDRLIHNIRWNNINGILNTLSQNMLTPFTGIFAIKLGAPDSLIAALSSWPALVSLLTMIPGARLVDRHPRQKRLVATLMLLNRIIFLLLALLPFLVRDPSQRPIVFVTMMALANMPGSLATIAWQSFMGKVIPPAVRGRAFATRNQLMSLCGIGASLFAGWMMDRLAFPIGFQIMFFVGFILALLEIAAFYQTIEPEAESEQKAAKPSKFAFSGKALLAGIRSHSSYWLFAGASLLFHFGWQMGWPLFTKYEVQVLGATTTWVSLIGVCNSLSGAAAYPVWAKLAERYGNQRMLALATLGMAVTPFLYLFCTQLWMLAVLSLMIGVSVAGTVLLLLNTLLELCPEEARTEYIAYHNTATNATAVVAPYVGIFLSTVSGIRWGLIATAIVRGLGALALALVYRMGQRVKEHPATKA